MDAIRERGQELYGTLLEELEAVDVDVGDYPLPESDLPQESYGTLYRSERDYLEQLEYYKAHRNGDH